MEMIHFIPPGQRRLAMLAAQADTAPVVIAGASGTGKGAIAKWIHRNSARAAKPIVEAKQDLPLIRQIPLAQEGTLIVPEIGEWPLTEQMALLNFLRTRSVPHPDDASLKLLVNARIIATTDQALDHRAQGGLFNAELLQKLNVFRIEMPALALRKDEFDDIVLGIVSEITREHHKDHLRALSVEAWERLRGYEWSGNLRELRNVLKVAVLTAKGDRIELADLPEFGEERVDFRATREQFERTYILELLKMHEWDIERTCRLARMDRTILVSKIERYGIRQPDSASL